MLPVDKRLRTTPPSRIFFKNVRSTSYQWHQDPDSRTDFYLLRKIARQSPPPALYPVIADIWMQEQAHILLRREDNTSLPIPTTIYWKKEKESGYFQLEGLSPISQYEFALNIYGSILKNYELEVEFPGEARKKLFPDQNDRQHYMLSMQDYLRLTEFDDDDEPLMSQKSIEN
jgi:hypothetical protein